MMAVLAFLAGLFGGVALACGLAHHAVREARFTSEMYFERWIKELSANRKLRAERDDEIGACQTALEAQIEISSRQAQNDNEERDPADWWKGGFAG